MASRHSASVPTFLVFIQPGAKEIDKSLPLSVVLNGAAKLRHSTGFPLSHFATRELNKDESVAVFSPQGKFC